MRIFAFKASEKLSGLDSAEEESDDFDRRRFVPLDPVEDDLFSNLAEDVVEEEAVEEEVEVEVDVESNLSLQTTDKFDGVGIPIEW